MRIGDIQRGGESHGLDKQGRKTTTYEKIVFTYAEIAFLVGYFSLATFDLLNRTSFNAAVRDSSEGKIRVDMCTADGWSVNYYAPWEGNYVTDDPWQDFNPTFRYGVINFM